jgi:hypothetical protein
VTEGEIFCSGGLVRVGGLTSPGPSAGFLHLPDCLHGAGAVERGGLECAWHRPDPALIIEVFAGFALSGEIPPSELFKPAIDGIGMADNTFVGLARGRYHSLHISFAPRFFLHHRKIR